VKSTAPAAAVAAPDRSRLSTRWERRDGHVAVTAIALGLTAIAVALAVFGLPPVDLRSPLHELGVACPFCGGTRSARYTAQGQLAEAWRYNPLGILVVALSVVALVRAAIGILSRRWLNVSVQLSPRGRRLVLAAAVLLLVLLEIRQQMRVDLLLGGG
jgi:hypothetical protein